MAPGLYAVMKTDVLAAISKDQKSHAKKIIQPQMDADIRRWGRVTNVKSE